MASSPTVTRSLRDGTIVVKDGTGTPKSVTVHCDDGNLTWTVTYGVTQKRCRGVATGHVKGDDVFCTGSFTAQWTQLTSDSGATNELYEMLIDHGEDVFTSTTSNGVYTLDIEFSVVDPSDPGGTNDTGEKITFADAVFTSVVLAEGEINKITVNFEIPAVKPTIARIVVA